MDRVPRRRRTDRNSVAGDLRNARHAIEAAAPYALRPPGLKDPSGRFGAGWMTRGDWQALPEKLREAPAAPEL